MKNRFGISKSLQGNSLLVKNHDAFSKSLQGISLFMKNHHVISKSLLIIGILIKNYDVFLKSIQSISQLMKKHQRISLKPSRVLVYSSRATPWFIEAPPPPPDLGLLNQNTTTVVSRNSPRMLVYSSRTSTVSRHPSLWPVRLQQSSSLTAVYRPRCCYFLDVRGIRGSQAGERSFPRGSVYETVWLRVTWCPADRVNPHRLETCLLTSRQFENSLYVKSKSES